ncbi:hypothetical protein BO94DRAFT_615379 [Aspergillus sclerotioniger CBS 115572]|uniref:Uncharacterized protein n=1 Tax=Aspergillus sclerotioniger CBS 115572 TaxID=1450535 RepID=A0A317XBB2_9EURO|nr:hypothetical protein BO94DRAFT_615379 [Aspergillus sclerotioniger CBS 115572]PWY93830.1 hypothetical protein BO94DRAFT_615379 [Aspergillus sclerotioniger CBS 115572]
MASARLRRAFRYPNDSNDDEHGREDLDEEGLRCQLKRDISSDDDTDGLTEQEQVIDRLRALSEKRNSEYSIIFAVIPLFSIYAFSASFLSGSSALYERCLSLLSVLSLLATAYTMRYFPLQRPGPKGKRPMMRSSTIFSIQRYLLPLNTAICVFLALIYVMTESRLDIQPIMYLVPGAMFATVLVARKVMLSVDFKALENLRYEYKGA